MGSLNGKRVALLEARMSSELARLVQHHGGDPYCVPALDEAPLACEDQLLALIRGLVEETVQVVVFLTGAGAKLLFGEAERLGRLPELLAALRGVTTVCRGPKPTAVLARHGVPVAVHARAPHTTAELLAAMAPLDLHGAGVAVVHYGERNETLAEALRARGARLHELCLYVWRLPADRAPLEALVRELIGGRFDAIAFTSQVQVRHLLEVATELGQRQALLDALQRKLIVASIGPTCTAALRHAGIAPQVEPEHGKMGHLVAALARYFAQDECRAGTAPADSAA